LSGLCPPTLTLTKLIRADGNAVLEVLNSKISRYFDVTRSVITYTSLPSSQTKSPVLFLLFF